ncbi:hypothetical protein GYB59_15295 [bacterium]|nr:hypothetical protein [bacterium]
MRPKSIENKSELAEWCGINRTTFYRWLKQPGFPAEPDGSISPFEVGRWTVLREIAGDTDEDGEPESDDLIAWKIRNAKEDYRKKVLANDKEEGSLVPIEAVSLTLEELANLLRGATEQVQRQYGNDAAEIINDTLDEFRRRVATTFAAPVADATDEV